ISSPIGIAIRLLRTAGRWGKVGGTSIAGAGLRRVVAVTLIAVAAEIVPPLLSSLVACLFVCLVPRSDLLSRQRALELLRYQIGIQERASGLAELAADLVEFGIGDLLAVAASFPQLPHLLKVLLAHLIALRRRRERLCLELLKLVLKRQFL